MVIDFLWHTNKTTKNKVIKLYVQTESRLDSDLSLKNELEAPRMRSNIYCLDSLWCRAAETADKLNVSVFSDACGQHLANNLSLTTRKHICCLV